MQSIVREQARFRPKLLLERWSPQRWPTELLFAGGLPEGGKQQIGIGTSEGERKPKYEMARLQLKVSSYV